MAMVRPTRYSVVSIGWFSSTDSVVDKVPDHTGNVFSVTGPSRFFDPAVLDSTLSVGAAFTATGAARFASTVTVAGGLTATSTIYGASTLTLNSNATIGGTTTLTGAVTAASTLTVGGAVTATGALVAATSVAIGGGAAITAVSSVTTAIDLPSIAGYATSTQTFGMSGLSRGDLLLYALDHDTSVLSNLRYLNIYVAASQTTAGEGTIGFSNNTNLTINQTSTVWRFTRIAQGAFV